MHYVTQFRFAAKHNLDYEMAASYAGVPGREVGLFYRFFCTIP